MSAHTEISIDDDEALRVLGVNPTKLPNVQFGIVGDIFGQVLNPNDRVFVEFGAGSPNGSALEGYDRSVVPSDFLGGEPGQGVDASDVTQVHRFLHTVCSKHGCTAEQLLVVILWGDDPRTTPWVGHAVYNARLFGVHRIIVLQDIMNFQFPRLTDVALEEIGFATLYDDRHLKNMSR